MSHQIITRTERIKLFIREYYTGNTTYINTIRIIGGPLIIGSGIHLYNQPKRFAIGYGGFCLLYGIYYLLKPLLIVALRLSLFQSIDFNLTVDEDKLELQDASATTSIQFSSFKSILRHAHYYAVKLPGKMTIYFKSSQLSDEEMTILNKHLTT